jgi:N-acetylglucosaminyl-diphospho-decaprenol L-rhamnosyltransferase
MRKPSVSVIIVSYKCAEALVKTLESVIMQDYDGPVEVIVFDNASDDDTVAAAKRFPEVRLIESPENVGFARANNAAVKESVGKHLFILNPDMILPQGLLSRLNEYLTENEDVGAVGPTLVGRSGRLQKYCAWKGYFLPAAIADACGLRSRITDYLFRKSCFYGDGFYTGEPKEVFSISGSCALVKRKAFEAAGGFDERYFLFGEDLDLFRTMRLKGFKVVYLPAGPAVHLTGASMGLYNPVVGAAGIRSSVLYTAKYRGIKVGLALRILGLVSLGLQYAILKLTAALRPEETPFSRRADYTGKVIKILIGGSFNKPEQSCCK